MSKRGLAELLRTTVSVESRESSRYEVEIQSGASRLCAGKINRIAVLYEYEYFIWEGAKATHLKGCSCWTPSRRKNESVSLAVRKFLLDGQGDVFRDFTVLYAAITLKNSKDSVPFLMI